MVRKRRTTCSGGGTFTDGLSLDWYPRDTWQQIVAVVALDVGLTITAIDGEIRGLELVENETSIPPQGVKFMTPFKA